ncbi:acetyltransferase [uncultured Desulfosarcina sp.]|uniref:acetyltransferase n=1 Tax=uncultured Desulfosarcina sp. TaxID=218289 RepID=UPI0029C90DEA|nr:acetyltransferase [uncultured Desulfosarcina sp.]
MIKDLILVGGGGHCKSCIDVIEQEGMYRIAGIVDVLEKLDEKVLGYKIIATDEDIYSLTKEYDNFLVTIGQIESPERRQKIFKNLKALKAQMPIIISPYAYVSRHASIGEGTIVMHQALLNAGAIVGRNCIINSKSLIEHEAVIEDHCHISTGTIINGGSLVKEGSFIGSNSVIRENITIERNSIIGLHSKIYKSNKKSRTI